MTDERDGHSTGGSQILHHRPAPDQDVAPSDDRVMSAIAAHFEKPVGNVAAVFHEIVSDRVHLDVHVIAPTPELDAWTLFTTGMSDRPMTQSSCVTRSS